jgi:hypothetical protein
MTETRDRIPKAVPRQQARRVVCQQNYSVFTCDHSWDECPHCRQGGSDAFHRGVWRSTTGARNGCGNRARCVV